MLNKPVAISDTGPLISMFQSNSFDLAVTLFGQVHTSDTCVTELAKHGWQDVVDKSNTTLITHKLTDTEAVRANRLAHRIAIDRISKDPEPLSHLGEAEIMVLAQRPAFRDGVLLFDELAARAVAKQLHLRISGFAGILLLAAHDGLLSANEVKKRLEDCRQQGTHYSIKFIQQVYKQAMSF